MNKNQTPKQEAQALIAELTAQGVEDLDSIGKGSAAWDGTPGEWGLDAWAPTGKVWAATLTHGLVIDRETAKEFWPAVVADLKLGLIPCDTPNCEGCE